MPRNYLIQYRRDTGANWDSVNPVPAAGEPCWDSTSKSLIVGDGTSPFNSILNGTATSTIRTQNLYVDKAAAGLCNGVDWTNAFTTIQAAINSLPAIINHAVTIYIRKGSTPYDEVITLQRVVAAGSITIRGEYYWTGTVATGGTGKFTLNAADPHYADRAQIAAGDKVILMAYSGTVENSTPSASYVDTVASVSGAEVTLTTNTSLSTTTSFTYQIVKTVISPNSSSYSLNITSTQSVTLTGLYISNASTGNGIFIRDCRSGGIYSCYFDKYVLIASQSFFSLYRCGGDVTVPWGLGALTRGLMYYCTIGGTYGIMATNLASLFVSNCHIRTGVLVGLNASMMGVIQVVSTLNNASTAKSPASNPGTDGAYII